MQEYDYIIAGGGAAGLSLAVYLANSSLNQKKILLIDREYKKSNDRTWCFWAQTPTLFEGIYYRSWDNLRFISQTVDLQFSLNQYRYNMVRGIDYYQYCQQVLARFPNIKSEIEDIQQVSDTNQGVIVKTSGSEIHGKFLFDSRYTWKDFQIPPGEYHNLKQHFLGWEISTDSPIFNPEEPIMFDFRTPQNGAMRFMYTLPLSKTNALVEYTLFSADLLSKQEYVNALDQYLREVFHLNNYQVLSEEAGIIPMTDYPFKRRGGKHILNIGTRGGRVKASTGYAFLRIQRDSEAIVRSLEQHGHPFHIPPAPPRYHSFDRTMLQVMYRNGGKMHQIFTDLFKNNPIDRLFRFLDEEGPVWENLLLMASVPTIPFIKAFVRSNIFRKV